MNYPIKILLTVDASFSKGDAGFGFAFSSAACRGRGARTGNNSYLDSDQAELAGIAAGCQAALKAHAHIRGSKRIVVACDSINALGALRKLGAGSDFKSQVTVPVAGQIRACDWELAKWLVRNVTSCHSVWARWIKGHTDATTPGAYIQAITDRVAKRARWQGVHERATA